MALAQMIEDAAAAATERAAVDVWTDGPFGLGSLVDQRSVDYSHKEFGFSGTFCEILCASVI